MSGKELYEVWAQGMAAGGIEVDPWSELGSTDQNAWAGVAEAVSDAG
jgi:hypothetical protein